MKKLFFTAVALMIGIFANAQSTTHTYFFGGLDEGNAVATSDDVEIDEWGSYTMDDAQIPSLSSTADKVLRLSLNNTPVSVTFKNSANKNNIMKCAEKYLQVDGKNGIIEIANVPDDAEISLVVSAKGDTKADFTDPNATVTSNVGSWSEGANAVAKAGSTEEFSTITCTRTGEGNKTVKIKEVAGGFRIISLSVKSSKFASTPIKAINADSVPAGKAVKTLENGQVIIIRDGVKYNMSGAVIK